MAFAFCVVVLRKIIPSMEHICFLLSCTSDTSRNGFSENKRQRGLFRHKESGQNCFFQRLGS